MPRAWGLPDRDYYVKTEKRFQEAREKYRVYVAHMIELSGKSRAESRRMAEAVFGMEKQLARGLARQRGPARPEGHRPQDELRRPHDPRPGLRLAGLRRHREASPRGPERPAAGVPEGDGPTAAGGAASLLEGLPRLAPRPVRRPLPLRSLRAGGVRLRGAVPRRGEGDEAALEALRRVHGPAARRGARPQVRREVLPARGQGPHAGAREEPAPRHGRHASAASTGWARGRRRRPSRSSRPSIPRSATPTGGRTTRRWRSRATRSGQTLWPAGSGTWTTTARRSASRWTAAAGG